MIARTNEAINTSTQLRMVAVGRMSPEITEVKYVDDAHVEACDFVDAYTMGQLDAYDGIYDPTAHYAKLGDIEQYIWGHRDEMQRLDERGDAIEDDYDWIRHGC